jgi:hypothetical protein
MPRYMVERTFADGLRIPMTEEGASVCVGGVERNAKSGVTWVQSYVSEDLYKTYDVYDGPSPDAIRAASQDSNLPIDWMTTENDVDRSVEAILQTLA